MLNSDDNPKFIISVKNKAKELGIHAQGSIYEFLDKTISLLPHIVGYDLVLSTVVPMIPSLIVDTVKKELFQEHVPDISRQLDKHKDELNYEFIQSPQGRKLFQNTIKEILEQSDKEKIEYLKQFLITSYLDKKQDSELTTTFFKILTDMEPIHIKLLTILKNPEEVLLKIAEQRKQKPRSDIERKYGQANYVLYWEKDFGQDDVNEFYLQTNLIVYHNALKDLVKWNILQTVFMRHWIYFDSTFNGNFESMINEMKRWTTDFGEQFVEFIYRR